MIKSWHSRAARHAHDPALEVSTTHGVRQAPMHAPCKRGTLGRQQARGARPTSVRLACGRTQAMHSRPAPYTMSMGSDELFFLTILGYIS